MNRFFTLVVTGIFFILFSSSFVGDVTVKMDMPDVIEAGTEITVNVTINKGNLTGFARFQQELPYGFTAVAVNSANADFSFQDQKVRLIWLRLPDNDEITVSYKIIANERLTGSIDLNGRFSYIENNDRKNVDVQPRMLAINASPNVDPAMVVDVKDYSKTMGVGALATGASRVAALRQAPVWMPEDNVFLVTILINKDAIQKFAKIEEKVPAGYTAVSVDSRGGIFTYKDKLAKIIWMDLPADPYFTVIYKLVPDEGLVVNHADMLVNGQFSYMINGQTMVFSIVEQHEALAGLTQTQVNNLLAGIVPAKADMEQQPTLVASTDNAVRQGTAPAAKASSSRTVGNKADDMLAPESGVYYRVQIAAGRKPVNAQRFFRRFRLEYSVMKEEHDGWFKYSVGSFPAYRDARDYRVHLTNTSTLNDAFIAAYNNGKRITVQEALMASNQKWYK